MAEVRIRRALLSVSDKTGLVDFARALCRHGVELVATGGTAGTLTEAGLAVTDVARLTGFPEMMDGRVKTLHPSIHGGILARRDDPAHRAAMDAHGIAAIDLVAVDLYPFEAALARGDDWNAVLEKVDIGGPALLRSAAKNHAFVTVIVDPEDYTVVLNEMSRPQGGEARLVSSPALRLRLAATAFGRSAAYDAAVARHFSDRAGEAWPRRAGFAWRLASPLRYGENPHQAAALYADSGGPAGIAGARQVQGEPLSYNNLNDADAALALVAEFEAPSIAIVKHANPCGVARAGTLAEAHERALACDPQSAFGGVVAANRALDASSAAAIAALFTEVVVAPGASTGALEAFAKRPRLRLLLAEAPSGAEDRRPVLRSLSGGLLVQSRDGGRPGPADLKVVTRRSPTEDEVADMLFALSVAKHADSNAVVFARNGATLGIGTGQSSRLDAVFMARHKAARSGVPLAGSVLASDGFFPFADGLDQAAEAGAEAVIQPGGSMRDAEVVAAADARAMAMAMTGMRHFRH